MPEFDVMAVGAHPDDVDFCLGGILAKLADHGYSIAIVDLTTGQKGTNGTSHIRKKEGEKAASLIGAERFFLDFEDGFLQDTPKLRIAVGSMIRKLKPRIVFAPVWKGEMSHPDHLAAGTLCRNAVRYARIKKMIPRLKSHSPEGILHYLFPYQESPDFLIDVSDYVELWKEMMHCHESQLKTYDYPEWNLTAARRYGDMIGTEYAQGLVKGNPVVVDDPMTIARVAREI